MSTKRHATVLAALTLGVALAVPATAAAQVAVRGGARVGVGVGVGWGWGYGPWSPYGAWGYGWGPWGPYGPWGGWGWGGPCCYYDWMFASARIDIDQQQADVYVDGYRAGIVDDFDNAVQRLNVWPGEHEITIFMEGYKTERHLLHMAQGVTVHIKGTLEKLPDGVKSEPPPKPAPRDPDPRDRSARGQSGYPRQIAPEPATTVDVQTQQPAQFGSVSIKVAPGDAVIAIDDQIWTGPAADLRLNIQIAAGRHHVEIRKDGYVTYAEDVLIRPGATLTLNVNLSKK